MIDQLSGSGVWPTQEIGMGATAFKNRCDEFRSVAIREALVVLSSTIEEETDQSVAQLISRVGRLDVNPLIVAENFIETARKVIRASERQASTLEAKFEGVDPKAQASRIQELFHSLISELDFFSVEGDSL